MHTPPLDELYLEWLYGQVADVQEKSPSLSYWKLFRQLYATEFVWWVPNDDNRAEDGRELRYLFVDELKLDRDQNWLDMGCSFLEMLIALSRRLEFESGNSAVKWFWHLIYTLELDMFTDRRPAREDYVEDVLNRVIHRTYRKDGQGGLFPLRYPRYDQTGIEIWGQLNAYLMENDN